MTEEKSSDGATANELRVGYVGLGAMGGALARRLLLSRPLTVYDANPDAVSDLVALGATPVTDLASLARSCDVVMTCLPTSAVVRQVLFGPGGLVEELNAGAIVIDQTTGSPSETPVISMELAHKGVILLDSPVSGGQRAAAAGNIAIFCGGPVNDFERIRPILADISPNIVHCGDVGTGHAAKVVQNAIMACNRIIAFECAAAACESGLSLGVMSGVIDVSSGSSDVAERIIPSLRTAAPISDFRMALMIKDLRVAVNLGQELGAPLMIANVVSALFQAGLNLFGPEQKLDDIVHFIERINGVTFAENVSNP